MAPETDADPAEPPWADPAMPRLRAAPHPPGANLAAVIEAALTGGVPLPTPSGLAPGGLAPGGLAPGGLAPRGGSWRAGVKVRLGEAAFLLHDPVTVETAPDGGHELRRARARQLTPVGRDVWLVQAHSFRPTSAGGRARDDLTAQGLLMDGLRILPGLPRLIDTVPGPGSVTLAVALPDARPLAEVLGRTPYPLHVLDLLWRGLPRLCAVLEALHARGFAHRALCADALLVTADGGIVPRDLGRAAFQDTAGDEPGPATDVRDLAALLYEAVTGNPPGSPPVPPGMLRPDAADLDDILLPALDPDPRARPPLARMARRLRPLAVRRVAV